MDKFRDREIYVLVLHLFNLLYRWSCDGLLSVSREDDFDMPFMSYKDRNPFVINYIGVSTAWGATGQWIIEGMVIHFCHCKKTLFQLRVLRLTVAKLQFNQIS